MPLGRTPVTFLRTPSFNVVFQKGGLATPEAITVRPEKDNAVANSAPSSFSGKKSAKAMIETY